MNAREDWLAERRKGIGGSDAAGVLGIAPASWNLTPLSIYLNKRCESQEVEQNFAMEMGQLLEPVILELRRRRTGEDVVSGPVVQSLVHPTIPFMRVNLDGRIPHRRRIIEAKLASSDELWGEPGTDQVPRYYVAQAQHEMAVTGDEVVEFAVLFVRFGIRDLQTYEVPRRDDIIEMMIERERELWQRILDGDPPDPITPEDIRLRWPDDAGHSIEATADVIAACNRLADAKARAKTAKEECVEAASVIQMHMGDASSLTYAGDTLCTWKKARDTRVLDAARLAVGHPEIVAEYSKPRRGSRRLLLKGFTDATE